MQPILILVGLFLLCLSSQMGKVQAQGVQAPSAAEPLGFLERFALSEQRSETLGELIPNTPEYFFFQVLHAQNEGRIAQARSLLAEWIAKHKSSDLTKRMETRQALLEYASNPNASIEYLQRTFGINTSHPAPKKNEAADLATKLDANLLDWKTIVRDTVKQSGIDGIEDSILADVLADVPNIDELRKWFTRSHRIDSPKLIERLVEELTTIHSRGFGWAPIHSELTLSQLEELQRQIPTLNQNGNYVLERLRHLLPSDDESTQDPAIRKRQLEQAEAYVTSLPEVHNSLIAAVLYQRLVFDLEQGTPDRDRFKRYLRLPNSRPICSIEFRNAMQQKPQVDVQAAFPFRPIDRPIGNDVPLIEKYLDLFFQTDASVDEFANVLERSYLQRLFATTKILHGLGDPKTYYAQLSPQAQKELAERIEVQFAPNNPTIFKTDQRVSLTFDLKNTPELFVRIYRINARNVLSKQQSAVSTALDLDGVVPNVERKLVYAQKSDRRHRESIELPELDGQGVWIVEVLAGGQRSRALVQKGQLSAILAISDAGQLVRIVNAEGEYVPTASVLIGEREFQPDKSGWILIPFEQSTQLKNMLLVDGSFAVLEPFNHLGEAYELRADFLVDPQSVLGGNRSAVVVRAQLLTHNQPIPLSNLTEIELRATSTDLSGVSNTQIFANLKLDEKEELTQEFSVPPRLASIAWSLHAKIKQMRTDTQQSLVATQQTSVNDFARSVLVHDSYLNRSTEGFRIELRGRNGEPVARTAVQLDFKLYGLTPTRSVRLASDGQGEIDLGSLAGVERFWVSAAGFPKREFPIHRHEFDWPQTVHAPVGETLSFVGPIAPEEQPSKRVGIEAIERQVRRYSLFEQRSGVIVSDQTGKLKLLSGYLEISGLEPGCYRLVDHQVGTQSEIQITAGERRDGWIVGKHRTLSKTPTQALAIRKIALVDGKLRVDLKGSDEATRLMVIASPYAHDETDHWLRRTQRSFAPLLKRERVPSFYIDSMKLDEEYQYVLARQQAERMLGSTLAHPTILLNPWELDATQNLNQLAQAGDEIAAKRADPRAASAAPAPTAGYGLQGAAGNSRDYGFLAQGTRILANIPIDGQGRVEFDAEIFDGTSGLSIVAITPGATAQASVALPWNGPRRLSDRRLRQSFDMEKHFIQKESVLTIEAGQVTDLGDVGVTRIRAYNSIAELFPLMHSLLMDKEGFNRFDCLRTWSKLSDSEKQAKYSELACHELHLFLLKHDPEFMQQVVIPHLRNKSPRQLVDDWILEQNLDGYLAPWRYEQLNSLERILLAKRFPEKQSGLVRLMDDDLKRHPRLFDLEATLFAQGLDTGSLGLESAGVVNLSDAIDGIQPERLSGGLKPGDPGIAAPGGFGGGMGGGGMGGMPGSGGTDSYDRRLRMRGAESLGRTLSEGKESRLFEKQEAGEVGRDKSQVDRFGMDGSGKFSAESDMPALAKKLGEEVKNGVVSEYDIASEDFRVYSRRDLVRLERKQLQLYEPLAATSKWAESQFDHIQLAEQKPSLVTPSLFWVDVLKNPKNALSEHLHLTARNGNEALLALAFVDLPLNSKPGTLSIENGRWTYKSDGKSLVYSQGIVAISQEDRPIDPQKDTAQEAKVLLSENMYLASADTKAKPVDRQELVIGVPYRNRVVLTNPTGNRLMLQILMQVPQGSIPLEAGRNVVVKEFFLDPFSTVETSHVFYFPSAGPFQHYGAQASSEGKYLAHVASSSVRVLDAPLNIDDSSWEYLAEWGSNDQVLAALDKVNIREIDFDRIAWRMQDGAFWKQVLNKLDTIGIYNTTLWAYSLQHRDERRLREFFESDERIVGHAFPYFDHTLMHVDLESRLDYEHLDFRPIVVARTHRLGREWKILNDGLAHQYEQLVNLLAYQPKILPRQRLSLTYYQLIQNRTQEALANFKKVNRADLVGQSTTSEAQMQYDYFDAYFAMRTGQYDRAEAIAKKYEAYPVPRWNEWFKTVGDQIRERQALQNGTLALGADPSGPEVDPSFENAAVRELQGGRETALDQGASKLPGLELVQKDGQIWITHRNIAQVQVHYYFVDVELMFSRNPFQGRNQSRLSVIEPNLKKVVDLEPKVGWDRLEWKVPEELKNRNMILEVVSGGIVRSVPLYSNSLNVNMSVPLGRLQVLSSDNKKPIEGAYVKVYARHNDGSVRFYKDAYTDLRGVMDYASLSTQEWSTVAKYSILVLHPEYGVWIQECEPPTR
jgi:hypothetical protein